MKIVKLKIDPNHPAILAYQEDFKRGYAMLSKEQKKLFNSRAKYADIQSKKLKQALIKSDK